MSTDTTKPTLSDEIRADLKKLAEEVVNDTGEGFHAHVPPGYVRVHASVVLSLLASLEEAEGRLDEHALFDAETDLAFKDLDATIAALTARAEKAEQQAAVNRNTFGHIRRHAGYPASGTLYDARTRLDHIAKLVDAAISPSNSEADNG